MKIKIKFCGITSQDDALNAIKCGADILGFIFFEGSSRYITKDKASSIIKKLPPLVATAGVFVNHDIEYVIEYVEKCSLNIVQLHGDETKEYCKILKKELPKCVKLIKAIRVKNEDSIKDIKDYPIGTVLLDSYKDDVYGGTGKTFDKSLALLAKEYFSYIILSGGLNPSNVYDLVKYVRPFGVDVSSGIESYPRKKNPELMEEFISEVKRAERS